MERKSSVTRSFIDALHSSDIQGDQMYSEGGVSPIIIHELHSWDIHGDQKEGERAVSRSIIDDLVLQISSEI